MNIKEVLPLRTLRKVLLLTSLFILMAGVLTACGKEGVGKLQSESYPRDNIVSVNIVSETGDITVTQSSSDTIRLEASYVINAKTRDRRELLLESISVHADSAADPSILSVYSSLSDTVTLAEDESVHVNLLVDIPQKMGSVIIQSKKGNILLDGLRGLETSLVGNEGGITLKNCSLMGSNHIINVIGDIEIRLKSIDNTDELRVSTDVGNVKVNVPQSASYEATIEQLSQKGLHDKNKDGRTKIHLTSKVGNVKFQK